MKSETTKGNNHELIKLKDELEATKNEWLKKKSEIESVELENIQEKCPTCQRDYDDTNQAKIIAQQIDPDIINAIKHPQHGEVIIAKQVKIIKPQIVIIYSSPLFLF